MRLDPRQRAMLEEMGISLIGWPREPAAAAPVPVHAPALEAAARPAAAAALAEATRAAAANPTAAAASRSAEALRPAARPAPSPATATGMAQGATVLAEAPLLLHGDAGAPAGGWLIVADMPPGLDGRHGEPYGEEAGLLLANMLRALHLPGAALPVHLMRTHRGVASGQPGSSAAIEQMLPPALLALAPRVVLAMGPLAAQSLLQNNEPLGKLRGRRLALPPGAAADPASAPPLVATYHPAYLLRNPADKARAWADLCLAAECMSSA